MLFPLIFKRIFHVSVLILVLATAGFAQKEREAAAPKTGVVIDSSNAGPVEIIEPVLDSTALDSLTQDSVALDTLPPKRQSPLDEPVNYSAADSMIFNLADGKVYLYGDAIATYGEIELTADFIEISLESKELYATGLPDSTGEIAGTPVFKQGEQEFKSYEMRYNFESKRGLSKRVKTQEGEGYLHGETIKRDTGEVIYIKNGKYTTCEYDDPHYHIHASKLKVIQNDKIVTGPAYLSIENVPTPLALPFGLFPNNTERSNGLIVPAWGEAAQQGFYLSRGGYYFGIKDRVDFALMGDIYSRGSWATYLTSRYATKYKYSGNVDLEYVNSKFSEPEYPDYFNIKSYNIRWTHNQDPKARPNSSFLANVNFGSSQNFRNNIQSSANDYLQSNLNSSIRYTQSFPNAPVPITANISGTHSTVIQDSTTTINFPNASINMARVYPFRKKNRVGEESILEKIGVNSSVDLQNRLSAKEDSIFTQETLENMKNGARWTSQMALNQKIWFFSITPTLNLRGVGYLQTFEDSYDQDSMVVRTNRNETADGFIDGNFSLGASTVIYGLYQYKSEVIKAMRHQMTPSGSVSFAPDFTDNAWGYYETIQVDSTGRMERYSRFDDGVYGGPRGKQNGLISFSLANTFELKVRDRSDSADTDKKLRLLDALNFSSNYNFSADSLNFAPLSIAVRTTVIPGFQFNGSATLDPYAVNDNGRKIDQFQFDQNEKLGRWTSARGALSWQLTPKKNKEEVKEKKEELAKENLYYTDFVDFDIPWQLGITYNIGYTNNGSTENVTNNLDLNGEVNVTQNWRVALRTSYDITNQDFGYSSLNIYRNLHCWEFSLNVVPFGVRQSYNFQINVKSAVLQDLKLNRRRNFAVPQR